ERLLRQQRCTPFGRLVPSSYAFYVHCDERRTLAPAATPGRRCVRAVLGMGGACTAAHDADATGTPSRQSADFNPVVRVGWDHRNGLARARHLDERAPMGTPRPSPCTRLALLAARSVAARSDRLLATSHQPRDRLVVAAASRPSHRSHNGCDYIVQKSPPGDAVAGRVSGCRDAGVRHSADGAATAADPDAACARIPARQHSPASRARLDTRMFDRDAGNAHRPSLARTRRGGQQLCDAVYGMGPAVSHVSARSDARSVRRRGIRGIERTNLYYDASDAMEMKATALARSLQSRATGR